MIGLESIIYSHESILNWIESNWDLGDPNWIDSGNQWGYPALLHIWKQLEITSVYPFKSDPIHWLLSAKCAHDYICIRQICFVFKTIWQVYFDNIMKTKQHVCIALDWKLTRSLIKVKQQHCYLNPECICHYYWSVDYFYINFELRIFPLSP